MQAIVFFGLFGFMVATVGGLIALSSNTTQKLRQMMVDQTRGQFADVASLVNNQLVPLQMQSPAPTGVSTTYQDIATYLCAIGRVKELLDCTSGAPRDPWHHNLTGVVVRQNQTLMTKNGLMFSAPITAYMLVSNGPNGVLDTTGLPTAPTQLTDLTRRAQPSGDDIMLVFTDQPGQMSNLKSLETAVGNVGQAAQRQYQQQFGQIRGNLQTIYNAAANNAGGTFDFTQPQMQNAWKVWADAAHPGPAITSSNYNAELAAQKNYISNTNVLTPSFAKLFVGSSLNTYQLGADGDVSYIQRQVPSGGQMVLNSMVIDSDAAHYGINDVILFSVSTTNTVWQQAVTPNCTAARPINCVMVKGSI